MVSKCGRGNMGQETFRRVTEGHGQIDSAVGPCSGRISLCLVGIPSCHQVNGQLANYGAPTDGVRQYENPRFTLSSQALFRSSNAHNALPWTLPYRL